jgi:hypothetical protein
VPRSDVRRMRANSVSPCLHDRRLPCRSGALTRLIPVSSHT